jgi:hypothetical protein
MCPISPCLIWNESISKYNKYTRLIYKMIWLLDTVHILLNPVQWISTPRSLEFVLLLDSVHKAWSFFANFVKSSPSWWMTALIQVGESLYFIIPDWFSDSKCVLGLIIGQYQHFSQISTTKLHFIANLTKTTKRAEQNQIVR